VPIENWIADPIASERDERLVRLRQVSNEAERERRAAG
jgi:hypothetical protein